MGFGSIFFGFGGSGGGGGSAITGTGTANRVTKFTGAQTIGNSSAVDDGSTVIWDAGIKLGLGGLTPTAYLLLPAGTAAANTAPFQLTAGTNNTTAQTGSVEYDGTLITFVPTGTTRTNFILNNYGKSGGQTIVGGTASSDDLTLSTTSNATKGSILFGTSRYNEANNVLLLNTNSSSVGALGEKLRVNGVAVINDNLYIGANGSEAGVITYGGGTFSIVSLSNKTVRITANGTGKFEVWGNSSERISMDSNGNVGINYHSLTAKFTVVNTAEQVRVGYDGSNYYSTTVGSTGIVTFDAVGAGSSFVFSDTVQASGYKSSDGTNGATAGPFTSITSITIKNGLVTAISGT